MSIRSWLAQGFDCPDIEPITPASTALPAMLPSRPQLSRGEVYARIGRATLIAAPVAVEFNGHTGTDLHIRCADEGDARSWAAMFGIRKMRRGDFVELGVYTVEGCGRWRGYDVTVYWTGRLS